MRTKILLILLLSVVTLAKAQKPLKHDDSSILIKYITAFAKKEDSLDSVFVSKKSFNAITQQIFSRVLTKSDDIVKNGTATNLKIDDTKSTISGNANVAIGKSVLFNVGIAGTTQGKTLSFFNSNSFSKGFTTSAGFDIKFKNSLIYYGDTAVVLRQKRQVNNLKELKKIKDIVALDTSKLNTEIKKLEKILELKNHNKITEDDIAKLETNFSKLDSLLTNYKNQLADYNKLYTNKDSKINEYVEKTIYDFELKNVPSYSYSIWWLNANLSFANNDYKIFDTTIAAILKKDTLKNEYYRSYEPSLSVNYIRNTNRTLIYIYGGVKYKNTYALQDIDVKDNVVSSKVVKLTDVGGNQVIDISKISNAYNTVYDNWSFELGGFYFWGKKVWGIQYLVGLTGRAKVPEGIEYRPSYNFAVGPVFSLSKGDGILSNGTVGLILSANNYYVNQTLGDVVAFGVRLGIPFNNIKL